MREINSFLLPPQTHLNNEQSLHSVWEGTERRGEHIKFTNSSIDLHQRKINVWKRLKAIIVSITSGLITLVATLTGLTFITVPKTVYWWVETSWHPRENKLGHPFRNFIHFPIAAAQQGLIFSALLPLNDWVQSASPDVTWSNVCCSDLSQTLGLACCCHMDIWSI